MIHTFQAFSDLDAKWDYFVLFYCYIRPYTNYLGDMEMRDGYEIELLWQIGRDVKRSFHNEEAKNWLSILGYRASV
jgi:hypothetical protein